MKREVPYNELWEKEFYKEAPFFLSMYMKKITDTKKSSIC